MKKILFRSILCAVILSTAVAASGCGMKKVSTTNSDQESTQSASFVDITPAENNTEITDEAAQSKPARSISTLAITDEPSCYHKALNSVDYFNYANGVIETNMAGGDLFTIEYYVDMVNKESYQHAKSDDFDEEVYSADGLTTTVDNRTEAENNTHIVPAYKEEEDLSISEESAKYQTIASDKQRITTDENGINTYYYRPNPTNLHYASTFSLFPQEMIFGFLSDQSLWEIKGTDEYLGREVTVITGTTEENYGQKLNINTFMMYFDNKTGIMLLFEGYDADGNITNYSKTTEFSDTKVPVPQINQQKC